MGARPSLPEPPSKVSATIFRDVGSEAHSTPRSAAGSEYPAEGVGRDEGRGDGLATGVGTGAGEGATQHHQQDGGNGARRGPHRPRFMVRSPSA